jgi:hypothetical protein
MTSLVPGQIVFLECRQTRLYAEVIQVLEARQTGWLRPLALVSGSVIQPLANTGLGGLNAAIAAPSASQTAPDMVWPLGQLHPALDTDVIPLLAQLSSKAAAGEQTPEPLTAKAANLTVKEFVWLLWTDSQAN